MSGVQAASPAVLALGGFAWRDATTGDAETLERLAGSGSNRRLFNLQTSAADFARALDQPDFRQPMICSQGSEAIGAAFFGLRSNRNLNLRLGCFFADLEGAALAVALYVRHLFWGLPLHRIHAQIPLLEGGPAYVSLLKGAGFREEGVVRGHVMFGGRPYDLAVLGVLREEFETWCLENESRIAL